MLCKLYHKPFSQFSTVFSKYLRQNVKEPPVICQQLLSKFRNVFFSLKVFDNTRVLYGTLAAFHGLVSQGRIQGPVKHLRIFACRSYISNFVLLGYFQVFVV